MWYVVDITLEMWWPWLTRRLTTSTACSDLEIRWHPAHRAWSVNTALAEEGRRPSDNYDIIRTDLSVIYLGPWRRARWHYWKNITVLPCWFVGIPCQVIAWDTMFNVFCWFIRCAFSQFSLFTLFFGSLSVVRVQVVSFVGRGARLWRHPG